MRTATFLQLFSEGEAYKVARLQSCGAHLSYIYEVLSGVRTVPCNTNHLTRSIYIIALYTHTHTYFSLSLYLSFKLSVSTYNTRARALCITLRDLLNTVQGCEVTTTGLRFNVVLFLHHTTTLPYQP